MARSITRVTGHSNNRRDFNRFAHFFGDVTIGRSTAEEIRASKNVHMPANEVFLGGRFAPLRH